MKNTVDYISNIAEKSCFCMHNNRTIGTAEEIEGIFEIYSKKTLLVELCNVGYFLGAKMKCKIFKCD